MKRVSALPLFLAILFAVSAAAEEPKGERPEGWGQPVELEGVPNLHKVSDALYRSAQPTAEGMQNLKELGVATIVNLRSFHSDRDEIGSTGLAYEHIYMKAWHPEYKEAVRFLQIVSDPKRTPVLVHCQHGADRTGTMTAVYRIAVEGWSKKQAIEEMTKGGYGYHTVWINLPPWLRELDVEKLRKDAGLVKDDDKDSAKDKSSDNDEPGKSNQALFENAIGGDLESRSAPWPAGIASMHPQPPQLARRVSNRA